MRAVGGGAFRENREPVTGLQTLGHFPADRMRMTSATALQEDGFVMTGQRADDRPVNHIVFGNKGHGRQRIHRKDIDPAHVVGGNQTRRVRQSTGDFELKSK